MEEKKRIERQLQEMLDELLDHYDITRTLLKKAGYYSPSPKIKIKEEERLSLADFNRETGNITFYGKEGLNLQNLLHEF